MEKLWIRISVLGRVTGFHFWKRYHELLENLVWTMTMLYLIYKQPSKFNRKTSFVTLRPLPFSQTTKWHEQWKQRDLRTRTSTFHSHWFNDNKNISTNEWRQCWGQRSSFTPQKLKYVGFRALYQLFEVIIRAIWWETIVLLSLGRRSYPRQNKFRTMAKCLSQALFLYEKLGSDGDEIIGHCWNVPAMMSFWYHSKEFDCSTRF
jgi:hypothetical protein